VGGQASLGDHRGPDRRRGAAERHEEGVAFGADLNASALGDGFAHDRRMLVPDGRVSIAELLEQPGGALDVGEQERDRPGRQLRHLRRAERRSRPVSRIDRGHLPLYLPASAYLQAESQQHGDNAQ
jgi:hypothetical protein